jgi:hypothetical protein
MYIIGFRLSAIINTTFASKEAESARIEIRKKGSPEPVGPNYAILSPRMTYCHHYAMRMRVK